LSLFIFEVFDHYFVRFWFFFCVDDYFYVFSNFIFVYFLVILTLLGLVLFFFCFCIVFWVMPSLTKKTGEVFKSKDQVLVMPSSFPTFMFFLFLSYVVRFWCLDAFIEHHAINQSDKELSKSFEIQNQDWKR